MKLRCAVLCALGLQVLAAADAALPQIRSVYLLPMSGGLDQYVANKLTQSGRYNVVTDVKQAHAIFTDQIGSVFEDRYRELFPPPAPPEAEKKKDDQDRSIGSMLGEVERIDVRKALASRNLADPSLVQIEICSDPVLEVSPGEPGLESRIGLRHLPWRAI